MTEDAQSLSAVDVIRILRLEPHPEEGGYFLETYRSPVDYRPVHPFEDLRSTSTAIYYLLTPDTFSAMHRLPGDEVFHFYAGDPVEMLQLHPDGHSEILALGSDLRAARPQVVVPGGSWQGSRLRAGGAWALLGTTMAPGFDFADYETGRRGELIERYPDRAALISALIRED